MAAAVLVRPDTNFVKDVIAHGGQDLKKCFQCGTCSVVCTLSPEEAPFPRKQMIEAQWGLKDRLLRDPALWLCHNCGACTTNCPRGARPGDVIGTLRREAIKYFAFPAFLGKAVSNPKAWPVLFLLPVLVFAIILAWGPKGPATEALEFANAFPIPVLEALFFAVAGFALLAFAVSVLRFAGAVQPPGSSSILDGLGLALTQIATHEQFAKCGTEKARHWGHLLMLWGFTGLALMGTTVGIGTMAGWMSTPLPLGHPLKVFANLCAAVILIGTVILLADRIRDRAKRSASTYFDLFFLLTLAGVVFTGILAELLRLAQTGVMYPVYFVHLALIFALFLYAPYSKFAHFAYRTVAIAAQKAAEKRPKLVVTPAPGGG